MYIPDLIPLSHASAGGHSLRKSIVAAVVAITMASVPSARAIGAVDSCLQCNTTGTDCATQCGPMRHHSPNEQRPVMIAVNAERPLVGKTRTYTDDRGRPFWVTYHGDGTIAARSANGTSSGGTWQIEGNQVCHDYNNPNWVRRACKPLK